MEKFINNAPFALVLVFLVIGFVLLISGLFRRGKFKCSKKTACSVYYYRTYNCRNGNITSGNSG